MNDARLVAWSGLTYGAAVLVGTLLALPSGLSEREMEWAAPGTWMPGLVEARASFVASMWVFHVSSFALILFGLGWGGNRIARSALVASGAAFLVETTMILAIGLGVAPRYVVATGDEARMVEAIAAGLVAFRVNMALLASLLLALGAIALAISSWRDPTFPRPLAGLAAASGVLGVLGGLSLTVEAFSMVRTLGIIAWTAFALLAGAHAWRAQRRAVIRRT